MEHRLVDNGQQAPSALTQFDLGLLVGLSVDDARAAIVGAGGWVRVTAPGDVVTADFRPDRVTLVVVNGPVVRAWGPS